MCARGLVGAAIDVAAKIVGGVAGPVAREEGGGELGVVQDDSAEGVYEEGLDEERGLRFGLGVKQKRYGLEPFKESDVVSCNEVAVPAFGGKAGDGAGGDAFEVVGVENDYILREV